MSATVYTGGPLDESVKLGWIVVPVDQDDQDNEIAYGPFATAYEAHAVANVICFDRQYTLIRLIPSISKALAVSMKNARAQWEADRNL